MEPDQQIELAHGTVRYRDSGEGKPIVFVHGLLVDGLLWRKVTPTLEGEFRCIVPDWPLGAHRIALAAPADRSPRGMAHLIADFLEAMELEEVTLVANDTGGAIAQSRDRASRADRRAGADSLRLLENFLPPDFRPLQWAARVPGALTAFASPCAWPCAVRGWASGCSPSARFPTRSRGAGSSPRSGTPPSGAT